MQVIHPRLKRQFRSLNVLVFERLGTSGAHRLATLSNATPISSLLSLPGSDCSSNFGHVSSLHRVVINDRRYVCFESPQGPVVTLVLHAPNDEASDELKPLVESALRTLRDAVNEPVAIPGAGIWQHKLASFLRTNLLSTDYMRSISASLECCPNDVRRTVEMVASCFDRISKIVSNSPPHTDDSSQDKGVLDLLSHILASLTTAFNMAQFVLGIGHYISDRQ